MEVDGVLSQLVEGTSISFEIGDDDRIAGKALNRFMGPYDPDSDTPFGPLATTLMAGPQEIMDQEMVFLQLIAAVGRPVLDRVHLMIGDRVVMVIERGGTGEL